LGIVENDMSDQEDLKAACNDAATHAQSIEEAILRVAVLIAKPGDWKLNPLAQAKLSSIGAERFLKHFSIEFSDITADRFEFDDEEGMAFRWVYRMRASLNGRTVYCEGRISSRDWKQLDESGELMEDAEPDEGGMMGAAMLLCEANGIKILLGLRHIKTVDLLEVAKEVGAEKNLAEPPETKKRATKTKTSK
jgi:hypothetical protein